MNPLMGGYASLMDLEAELTLYRVSGTHEERNELYSSPVLHEGYQGFVCAVCGNATLRARGRNDVTTCGWLACMEQARERLQQSVYREEPPLEFA